jgi:hypothetical protein
MRDHAGDEQIEAKYRSLSPLMDERMPRQWPCVWDSGAGVPFSAGNQQVEQDRASHVLPHDATTKYPSARLLIV